MKVHANTLFITTQGAYVNRDGETLQIKVEKETRLRMPINAVGDVVCFGRVSFSPFALGLCGERGVAVSMLSNNGCFLARLEGPTSGNVRLRREQYRRADDLDQAAQIARPIISAKIANSRGVLLRARRQSPGADPDGRSPLDGAVAKLAALLNELQQPMHLDQMRGLEGDAANAYFAVFDHLITNTSDSFRFTGRSRRPPMDNINAMLSFIYVLLSHDVRSACETIGLDPQVGFMHRDRPGRHSLALDLMEELRAPLADRLVLSLVNRQQVSGRGFSRSGSDAVEMTDATRKTLLTAWQERKMEEISHPFTGEKISIGLIPHIQARLLARHLRGDLDMYPPMFWK